MAIEVYRSFSELKAFKRSNSGDKQRPQTRVLNSARLELEILKGLELDLHVPTDAEIAAEVAREINLDFEFHKKHQLNSDTGGLGRRSSSLGRESFTSPEKFTSQEFVDRDCSATFSAVDRWLCHCAGCQTTGISVLNTMRCRELIDPVERTIESNVLSELYCVGAYRWAMDQNHFNSLSRLIRLMKTESAEHLPVLLGRLVTDALALDMPEVLERTDVLIPVPPDTVRAAWRGFDNVAAIAEWISEFSHIPLDTLTLEKPSPTKDLRQVPFEQRANVIRGAFSITSAAAIKGKNILLFDDVVTSGSTLDECAEVLLDHGAHSVSAVALGMSERTAYVSTDDDEVNQG
jgi:predicted amidophosphoribosyltransferase